MKKTCTALAISMATFVGCAKDKPEITAPESQIKLSQLAKTHRAKIEQASESNNQLAKESAIAEADAQIHGQQFTADRWISTVAEINQGPSHQVIETTFDNQTFKMKIADPSMKSWVSSLKKGDTIIFSGNLGKESSITTEGAVRNPEFSFYPSSVKRPDDPIDYTQSQDSITNARKNEEEAAHTELIRMNVIRVCEEEIKRKATVKSSVDFSIIHLAIVQTEKNTWIYKNKVKSTNALGVKFEDTILCVAKTKTDADGTEKIRAERIAKTD